MFCLFISKTQSKIVKQLSNNSKISFKIYKIKLTIPGSSKSAGGTSRPSLQRCKQAKTSGFSVRPLKTESPARNPWKLKAIFSSFPVIRTQKQACEYATFNIQTLITEPLKLISRYVHRHPKGL